MDFMDRVGWVLLGMALGYIIRILQEMKKEVEEVDEILTRREQRQLAKQNTPKRDERGVFQLAHGRTIAIAVAIMLCIYATWSTGATNNKLEDAIQDLEAQQTAIEASQEEDVQIQLGLARVTVCTQEYLTKTIKALNDRTTFTVEQAQANIRLQEAQANFFQLLLEEPPRSEEERRAAALAYVNSLEIFVKVGNQFTKDVKGNPYPTSEDFLTCLNTKTLDEKKNPDELNPELASLSGKEKS